MNKFMFVSQPSHSRGRITVQMEVQQDDQVPFACGAMELTTSEWRDLREALRKGFNDPERQFTDALRCKIIEHPSVRADVSALP